MAPESGRDCFDVDKVLRINALLSEAGSVSEVISTRPASTAVDSKGYANGRLSSILANLTVLRTLVRRIGEFDAVFLHYTSGTSFAGLVLPIILLTKFFGKKVVLDYRQYAEFARIYDGGPIQNRVLGLCDRVMMLSEFQHHRLERYNLRGGYLPEYLRTSRTELKKIESLQPRILVAGPLEKISNTICVIKAYRLVKQKYPRTELIVAGEGTKRQGLEELVRREKLPGITFRSMNSIAEMEALMNEADLFVNCSYLDYLPAPLLEAAASGLPIISTPSVSVLETFSEGESVLFGRHNDHVSLSDKIIELVENPELARKLCRHAHRQVESFRWEKVRSRWQNFFSSLKQ